VCFPFLTQRKKLLQTFQNDAHVVSAVVGTQWGDEGKGKVVDLLSHSFDIVARYQGGPNAGHTVKYDGKTFVLHHIPTGILRPGISCVLGNGMVINIESLIHEIDQLSKQSIDVFSRLLISENAHIIMPYHIKIDCASESSAHADKEAIGTTGRGIGPAYADKARRTGVRIGDLLHPSLLEKKVKSNVEYANKILRAVYDADGCDYAEVMAKLEKTAKYIDKNIVNARQYVCNAIGNGKKVLLEGAQGTHLDIDFGTYPFVTSSNTTIGGACTGLGVGPKDIGTVIGIMKAYTTRVGNGPFPTELEGPKGEKMRKIGDEFGATTGRPRRCGWWDGVAGKISVQLNNIDYFAITKLDVLDTFESIRICTGYKLGNRVIDYIPSNPEEACAMEPVYEEVEGWNTDITGVKEYEELPEQARNYLEIIEKITGVPVMLVSVGPRRKETIWKNEL